MSDDERVDAAAVLADDGEFGPLRSLLETPGIDNPARLRAAVALMQRREDKALLAFAGGKVDAGYYVAGTAVGLSLQYGALTELHCRRHPAASGLMKSFVDSTNAPCTYGAAAMLAEAGDFEALIEVSSSGRVHPAVATVSASTTASAWTPRCASLPSNISWPQRRQ